MYYPLRSCVKELTEPDKTDTEPLKPVNLSLRRKMRTGCHDVVDRRNVTKSEERWIYIGVSGGMERC